MFSLFRRSFLPLLDSSSPLAAAVSRLRLDTSSFPKVQNFQCISCHARNLHTSLCRCMMFMGDQIEDSNCVIYRWIRQGYVKKHRKKRKNPMSGQPQLKGVVIRPLIKKPKKPNSANRKCVQVRLSNRKTAVAYVPGEGHNLQEHNIVLIQGGKVPDLPGVKLRCVRGKYDLAHVKKSK